LDGSWQYTGKVGKTRRPVRARVSGIVFLRNEAAALSPSEILAQSVALIAPTGAPVMTVPTVFGLAGNGCAIAFLISTVTILLVALNVNQFAGISASPGSLYTCITGHMHPRFGVLAGPRREDRDVWYATS
jgi:hypothetical protein